MKPLIFIPFAGATSSIIPVGGKIIEVIMVGTWNGAGGQGMNIILWLNSSSTQDPTNWLGYLPFRATTTNETALTSSFRHTPIKTVPAGTTVGITLNGNGTASFWANVLLEPS